MERPLSGRRAMEPSRQPFAHHVEGFDLCAHRRNRRRGNNLLARAPRRRSELGLSLLLAKDATFTLLAFMHLGYYEEARDWRDWLVRAVAGSPEQVQIVYGVGGERWLPELIVPWLPGYEKSSPVRIGNAAYQQLQIDVFGEIADAMLQNLKAGMGISERARALRSYWNTWPARGGSRTKAFGKCAADLSTSSIQRSWPGLHSIAPPTRWRRKCTKIQFSDGETLLEKFMRTFVSVDLTQSLTVSCSPMAPSGSMPACC